MNPALEVSGIVLNLVFSPNDLRKAFLPLIALYEKLKSLSSSKSGETDAYDKILLRAIMCSFISKALEGQAVHFKDKCSNLRKRFQVIDHLVQ